jgi:hypothetical protein
MMNFLTNIVSDVYDKGVKAGEAYANGVKEGTKKAIENQPTENQKDDNKNEQEKTFGEKVKDTTGISNF